MDGTISAAGITGRTRVYGILADPIYHVKAPAVMGALFARHGVDGVLVPLHVTADGLAAVMDGLRHLRNFGGFIATVPHKTTMTGLCDALTREAEQIGAVNCVRREADGRMIGTMLDGIGFVEALRASGLEPRGRNAALAGAGGAASAIAFALAEAGVARLTILNRTAGRAQGWWTACARPTRHSSSRRKALSRTMIFSSTAPRSECVRRTLPRSIRRPSRRTVRRRGDHGAGDDAAARRRAGRGCRIQKGLPMLERQIALMARHMGAL